jgi:hypothetical protein
VLEGCRHGGVEHLVYASSSSVYGANTKIPFSVDDNVDHPVSLYAASKKANELMAHTYAHLFASPPRGLRFFTVYGPWGRPDMALFLFTKAILAGEPIQVFNHGRMRRDFTYVDDVIEGVVRVLDRCRRAIPPGTATPDPATSTRRTASTTSATTSRSSLMHLIEVLEDALGAEAVKRIRHPAGRRARDLRRRRDLSATSASAAMAQRHDGLITIGITPTHPATGYGYVKRELPVDQGYYVERFVEKPSLEHARAYLKSRAGSCGTPASSCGGRERRWRNWISTPRDRCPLREAAVADRSIPRFPTCRGSASTTRCSNARRRVFTVQGTFGWDDVGDWIALERLVGRGAADPLNTVVGHHVGLRASGNIVYTEDPNDVVVTVGVEDLVIVKRGNTILLLQKDRIGEIKDVLADERLAALAAEAPPARETGRASPAVVAVEPPN